MLAVSAASFGIVASFITTFGLGVAALIRATRGDTALKEATNAKSLWDQTSTVITGLQAQVDSYRVVIDKCEEDGRKADAAHNLMMAELADLKLDHLKLVLKLERIESQP